MMIRSIPSANPMPGVGCSPNLLCQIVIPTTTTDCVLCTQSASREFKCGTRVVIQSPNDVRIFVIFNFESVEITLYHIEILTAAVTQIVRQKRCVRDNSTTTALFAIQYPHRIAFVARITFATQFVKMRLCIRCQIFNILWTTEPDRRYC